MWQLIVACLGLAVAHVAFVRPEHGGTWIQYAGLTGAYALAVLFVAFPRRASAPWRQWLTYRSGDPTIGILTGAALYGCAYVAARFVFGASSPLFLWALQLWVQLGDRASFTGLWALPALTVLVVIAEEVFWRGLVLSIIRERVGLRGQLLASSLLPALTVAGTVYTLRDQLLGPNPLLMGAAFVLSATMSFLVLRTGRLVPAVLAHLTLVYLLVMFPPLI